MSKKTYKERLQRCGQLMQTAGIDVLILVKPANMHYLTGDGRLCAYANCGLYTGPWGVRNEDTVAVGQDGTHNAYKLSAAIRTKILSLMEALR